MGHRCRLHLYIIHISVVFFFFAGIQRVNDMRKIERDRRQSWRNWDGPNYGGPNIQ